MSYLVYLTLNVIFSVVFLKPWIWIGCFSNSTGSSATSDQFFPFIVPSSNRAYRNTSRQCRDHRCRELKYILCAILMDHTFLGHAHCMLSMSGQFQSLNLVPKKHDEAEYIGCLEYWLWIHIIHHQFEADSETTIMYMIISVVPLVQISVSTLHRA
jgi:hypothetical protein